MTQMPIVRQILSDPDTGLLPYLREQLQTENFLHFKALFGFHVDQYSTQVTSNNNFLEVQTALLLTLNLSIVVDSQTPPDEATLHALVFQELLDTQIIIWSKDNSQLLKPISQIKGNLGQLSEIPYQGGYLPGFEIRSQFTLNYSAGTAQLKQSDELTQERPSSLYSSGERTPISGQYELINSNGEGTGLEVTSTAGNPFPPTSEPEQSHRLVDPTVHKKRNH
ncbi:hypothetical protein [Komarekiella delphini-convector]|uniref:hypothetical protein n=1 Tax=Komarekiella delphini-convector TaxID=3050158 RepID=UPI00177B6B50|nr:hypothetical protein [Komarekiella delphini-convector]